MYYLISTYKNVLMYLMNTCNMFNTSLFNKCPTKFSVKRSNPDFSPCIELFAFIAHHLEVDVNDTIK